MTESQTFQRENVVGKHDDFVIPSLVEFDQELRGAEFVGVHGVEKHLLHARHGQIFAVKLWRHRTPNLRALNLETDVRDVRMLQKVVTRQRLMICEWL